MFTFWGCAGSKTDQLCGCCFIVIVVTDLLVPLAALPAHHIRRTLHVVLNRGLDADKYQPQSSKLLGRPESPTQSLYAQASCAVWRLRLCYFWDLPAEAKGSIVLGLSAQLSPIEFSSSTLFATKPSHGGESECSLCIKPLLQAIFCSRFRSEYDVALTTNNTLCQQPSHPNWLKWCWFLTVGRYQKEVQKCDIRNAKLCKQALALAKSSQSSWKVFSLFFAENTYLTAFMWRASPDTNILGLSVSSRRGRFW